jgi:hypothetical protein
MDSYNKFSKTELLRKNSDPKYGYGWIQNLENVSDKEQLRIYPTEDSTLVSGRKYIAFPANRVLTKAEIAKYNIIMTYK